MPSALILSTDVEARFRNLWARGATVKTLAAVAGCHASTVQAIADRLGLMPRGVVAPVPGQVSGIRKCLCCSDLFRSQGAHNRMCVTCRGRHNEMQDCSIALGGA